MELRKLGLTKAEFARLIGLSPLTVYQWKQVPSYAEWCVGMLRRVEKLEEKLTEARKK